VIFKRDRYKQYVRRNDVLLEAVYRLPMEPGEGTIVADHRHKLLGEPREETEDEKEERASTAAVDPSEQPQPLAPRSATT
jgi:hypothetical protein